MKTLFSSKTLIALAIAICAAAVALSQAQEQPIPPPTTSASSLAPSAAPALAAGAEAALPANIPPDTALAQIFKLVQAGVDVSIIKSYIANSQEAFNLDAEKIIAFNDAGAPPDLINAMMRHDKSQPASAPVPAPPPTTVAVETAPPTAPVTVTYFEQNLSPYGNWVEVEGYGRCWRPTVVVYDNSWRPYCDRGHWVYTDCGWYWNSEYSWGATFHYGRWFRHSSFGWCWYPDTVWAPSWVAWRSGGDYCGWAPLPPYAAYHPGAGFYYRGASVSIGFSFGLQADCFTFVSYDRFCDRHPRYYAADNRHVTQIYNNTTVINNYGDNNRTIVNNGVSVDRVRQASHRDLKPVAVAQVPGARREGWRGEASRAPQRDPAQDVPAQGRRNPGGRNGENANAAGNSSANANATPSANSTPSFRDTTAATTRRENRNAAAAQNAAGQNSPAAQNGNSSATGAPATGNAAADNSTGSAFVRQQPRHITPPVTGGATVAPSAPASAAANAQADRRQQRVEQRNNQQAAQDNAAQYFNSRSTANTSPRINQAQPEPRQFTSAPSVSAPSAPSAPSAASDRWQQRSEQRSERQSSQDNSARNFSAPPTVYNPPHAAPQQIEQHQYTAPSAPDRSQQREQRIEQRQSVVENAVHNSPPPSQPSQSSSQSSPSSDRSERPRDRQNR